MNSTKKYLIIAAIVTSILGIAYDIYDIVMWFLAEPAYRSSTFYVVFAFLEIAASIAVVVLLILAIWKNGVLFRQRYGYYMTALVLSIIFNLFSVTSVLLIITMFISDWVWIIPEKDKTTTKVGDNVEVINETKEEKIARLRKMKEDGVISEEEFQQELLKLL